MASNKIMASAAYPHTTLSLVGGGSIELGKPRSSNDWQMVVVYRGKHCPLCAHYLKKLEALQSRFNELKVDVVAVSGDGRGKAERQVSEGGLTLTVAYDLSIEQMQELGLYISHPRSPRETDKPFAEPGIFVVNDEARCQVVDISNAPFSRPDLEAFLQGLAFIRDPGNNYPIRGTY